MLNPIENYFHQQEEPFKSCLLFLREYILKKDSRITETMKYGMPCYCYAGKPMCYLWIHKKYKQPYILFVDGNQIEHAELLQEKRARMKILLINPEKDIPLSKLNSIFNKLLRLYNQ